MKGEYLKIIREKGEFDFEVSCKILDLTQEEYDELRKMLVVAIGAMEEMWEKQPIDVEIMKNTSQESEAYYYGQYKDYKSRNEKAVSILKDLKYIDKYKFTWDREFNKALNILNGGDDNE